MDDRSVAEPPDHDRAHAMLKARSAAAAMWSVLRVGGGTVTTFVLFLVLARLLGPTQFGLFALASLIVEIGRIVAGAGLGDAVTREVDLTERFSSTAFWFAQFLGLAVGALVALGAPWYAMLVNDRSVIPVIQALAVLMPISALGVVHSARLARDFGHKTLAWQGLLTGAIAGAAAVFCAYTGMGVWSLVVQGAVGSLLGTALIWWSCRWRPALVFDVALLRSLLAFNLSMMASQLLWILLVRMQDIFIGRAYGAAEVGRYRVAWRLIEMIGQTFLAPISSVALVTLSNLQGDRERFSAAYNRFIAVAALGVFPMLFGFAVLANDVVLLLFGDQWAGAGEIARVLCLMAVPFVMNFFSGPALAAMNRPGLILKVAASQALLTGLLTWLALPYGLLAVAAAYVMRSYLTMPYPQFLLARNVGVKPIRTLKALAPSLFSAVAMAGVVWVVRPYVVGAVDSPLLTVAVCGLLGGVLYAALILLVGRHQIRPLVEMCVSVLPSKGAFR